MLFASGAAQAKVAITVDKNTQTMTVAVDGVERYRWPVSTGNPSHETPNGNFRAFRMEEDHYSKEFDDAPMPHSIFFTKIGHAIHGTDSVSRLGTPASHGCVRLSRDNATTLYALVRAARRAQHDGDADRLVADRAGPQPARSWRTAVAARELPRPSDEQQYSAAGEPIDDHATAGGPGPPSWRRKLAPTTAISIPPTAIRTSRAIRHRAVVSTTRRPIRSRRTSITTTPAMWPSPTRRSPTTSSAVISGNAVTTDRTDAKPDADASG